MINLQDVTKSLYRLIAPQLGLVLYNKRAKHSTNQPYAVFNVTEAENHEYFSGTSDSDLMIDVSFYYTTERGAGYVRRSIDALIAKLHKTTPAIAGMIKAEIRMLPSGRGQVEFVGNNIYQQTVLFSLRGTSST